MDHKAACDLLLRVTIIGVKCSNMVEETGEPGENHPAWTGDHYPTICPGSDLNPDRRGDKQVRYPLRYPEPK